MTYNFSDVSTVDHMTHLANLEGILANGLLAHNNKHKKIDISNQEVNRRRSVAEPIYNKSMHDYVPFYFNPRNAMMYRNQKSFDQGHIVVLGFNKNIISTLGAVYTDGNASRNDTYFSKDTAFLESLNWNKVFSRSWYNYGEYDEETKSSMMSELLILDQVGVEHLDVIFCATEVVKQYIISNMDVSDISVEVCPYMFF